MTAVTPVTAPGSLPSRLPTEWYDNSTIDRILTCARKAFYTQFYRGGLSDLVGPGAHLGTCFHAGVGSYMLAYGKPLADRKLLATRAFSTAYAREFPVPGEPPRDFENCLRIMLDYCERWATDDTLLIPIEPEIGFKFLMQPEDGDVWDFAPFWIRARIDGLYRLEGTNDLVNRETKTTSSGVRQVFDRLKLARQIRSYAYLVTQAIAHDAAAPPGTRFFATLGDVISVAKQKRDYARDWIESSPQDLWEWRQETIHAVETWRGRIRRALFEPLPTQLAVFGQDPQRCTDYGRCSFYDACRFNLDLLDDRPRNLWDPLAGVAADHIKETENG